MAPLSSKLTATEMKVPTCSNSECPSHVAHNHGYYNFSLSYRDETTRSNELPHDIRKALDTIHDNQSKWLLEEDKDAYVFLAKFAVAHHSHLEGLMPRMITKTSIWRESEIQKILEGAGPRPIPAPLEPVKKEETKAIRNPCRLKNAMGRGGAFTGKTGVTIVYPGQNAPTPAGTLPSFEPSKEILW